MANPALGAWLEATDTMFTPHHRRPNPFKNSSNPMNIYWNQETDIVVIKQKVAA